MRWVLVLAVAVMGAGAASCGSAQNAAAKDPMRCERDPSCSSQRAKYPDCTRQCNDDQECEARCEQVQRNIDTMGHP